MMWSQLLEIVVALLGIVSAHYLVYAYLEFLLEVCKKGYERMAGHHIHTPQHWGTTTLGS